MEYKYTIDPLADPATMLIDEHLGYDNEDGQGINGGDFCRELMLLDTLNKSKIDIWINSPGGSVTDADAIISGILKSKTKVDTHNIGVAASSAGTIFLAGRKRYMMPHAKFMMHPVSGGDLKTRQAFENSTVIALSNRVPVSETEIRRMMNETTWLTAIQCRDLGMCEVDDSASLNKPYGKPMDSVNYKDFKSVVNKLVETKKPIINKMKQVTNKLKLVEGSDEVTILAAIGEIENRATKAESKLHTQETENKVKVEDLTNKVNELTEAKNKLEKEISDKKAADELDVKNKLEAEAKQTVSNMVKLGKLKNDAKVIEAAEKNAISDLEGFKTLMEAMPVSKQSPGSIVNKAEGGAGVVKYNVAGIMANIAIKNKQTTV